jgi:hypothetical protein
MNYIETFRKEIRKNFNEETFQKGDFETHVSPSNKFQIETTNFFSREPNWDLTKVEVFETKSKDKLFDFYVNESRFLHSWVRSNGIEYLVCAEDVFGGQTIVDLTNKKIEGYSPNEDGFIWTDFHLSSDGTKLATIGCYWACPYVIKIFDFTNPLILPLKEITEIKLLDNDEIILGWLDNATLQMKGVQRQTEPEYIEGGGMRMKIINETNVERQLKINGI